MRNRVKELRFVKASELTPCADNWRLHPKRQRDLMKSVLQTIGYADAEVPVLIVDLNANEAKELLLVHDPIGAMAERDDEAVARLLEDFEATNETLERFIGEEFNVVLPNDDAESLQEPKPVAIPNLFQIIVECEDETEQRECFEELTRSGRKCRVVNL